MSRNNYTGYQVGWWKTDQAKTIRKREEQEAYEKHLMRQMRVVKMNKMRSMVLPIVACALAGILMLMFLF